MAIALRTATPTDAETIAKIYNREVIFGTSTFDLNPRSVADQVKWLSERRGAFSAIVANDQNLGIVGFAALSMYRDRAGYRTTVENSVYVHHEHRGRGVGKLLLTCLIGVARDSGFHTMVARIESNSLGSLKLHHSLGFVVVGVEREIGRKFGRWLDSVIMQLMI